jgi:hypothetical protein
VVFEEPAKIPFEKELAEREQKLTERKRKEKKTGRKPRGKPPKLDIHNSNTVTVFILRYGG